MEDVNTSARLRNACDACHRLKRKCTGSMPCENCSLSGSSCFYSVAGRLGRPPGSRSRRNAESARSSKTRDAGLSISLTGNLANSELNNMLGLDLSLGSFDQMPSYEMFMNPTQNPDPVMNPFPTIEADPNQVFEHLSPLDISNMSPSTSGNNTPLSISPIQMQPESQRKQPEHQNNTFVQTPFLTSPATASGTNTDTYKAATLSNLCSQQAPKLPMPFRPELPYPRLKERRG
ncbi:hypothetical protein PG988_000751 [Apiospora saccharicola]